MSVGPGAPARLFRMLEAAARERIDRAVDDADRAAPFGPAIAVRDARAAPADADLAVAKSGFALDVAVPDATAVVVRGDFVPALQAEKAVVDFRGALRGELVALQVLAARREADDAVAGSGKRMTRAQRLADGGAVEVIGNDAGDPALRAEHLGAGQSAARRPRCSSPEADAPSL
jgi:hypothetical protein